MKKLTNFLYQKTMAGRDPHEHHRAATPLELFFDLVYVVAIAAAASGLHHAISAHHVVMGLSTYLFAFFCVWWAWMNFTWFASAFDTDDVSFRLMALIQMFGSLVLAAGIGQMFLETPSITTVLIGYCIMRVGLVAQWIRAAIQAPKYRRTAITYAIGIIVMQCGWIGFSYVTPNTLLAYALIAILIAGELAVPFLAERHNRTPWHSHHMAERYGLLVIIVLGEGILGSLNTIANAVTNHSLPMPVILSLGLGGLAVTFSLWWAYFDLPEERIHSVEVSLKKIFPTAYGHFFLFASLAAVGTGLELLADSLISKHAAEDHAVSPILAMSTLSFAILASLLGLLFLGHLIDPLHRRFNKRYLIALGLCFLPVLAVAIGLSLNIAVWLSVIAPIVILHLPKYRRLQ